jgi:hypothetical protein
MVLDLRLRVVGYDVCKEARGEKNLKDCVGDCKVCGDENKNIGTCCPTKRFP